jgi:TPR repeat protein
MASSRMIRCINGHVFDAATHAACPICGWTEAGAAITTVSNTSKGLTGGLGANPVPPDPNRNLKLIGGGASAFLAIIVVAYLAFKPAPVPDPINDDPKKTVEKTPEKTAEKPSDQTLEKKPDPQASAKLNSSDQQKSNGLPRFDTLEPLTQDAQSAAAGTLGLSPFTTQMALLTRATRLASVQPAQIQSKRLLIPFIKENQPLALAEAGSSSYFGYAVEVNDQLALDYLTRGADQGSVWARAVLAQMLFVGRGKPRDDDAARKLLLLAARADSVSSPQILRALASVNLKLDGQGPNSYDMKQAMDASNWGLASKLAQELADVQIAQGYYVLGLLNWEGDGIPKDTTAAIDWWKKATALGYSNASYSLSVAARTPPSGSGNLLEAMVWLEIAFLQSEDKQRALYYTDKITAQAGLLDRGQWTAIKTLFSDITIPGAG